MITGLINEKSNIHRMKSILVDINLAKELLFVCIGTHLPWQKKARACVEALHLAVETTREVYFDFKLR